jgi:hypothetical protein
LGLCPNHLSSAAAGGKRDYATALFLGQGYLNYGGNTLVPMVCSQRLSKAVDEKPAPAGGASAFVRYKKNISVELLLAALVPYEDC